MQCFFHEGGSLACLSTAGCCPQDGRVFSVNRKRSLFPWIPASISRTNRFEDLGWTCWRGHDNAIYRDCYRRAFFPLRKSHMLDFRQTTECIVIRHRVSSSFVLGARENIASRKCTPPRFFSRIDARRGFRVAFVFNAGECSRDRSLYWVGMSLRGERDTIVWVAVNFDRIIFADSEISVEWMIISMYKPLR